MTILPTYLLPYNPNITIPPAESIESQEWQGHAYSLTYSLSEDFYKNFSSAIKQIAYSILLPLNLICNSPSAAASIYKRTHQYFVALKDSAYPTDHTKLISALDSSYNLMNLLQIPDHVNYFTGELFKKDNSVIITSKCLLFISQFGEGLLWLGRKGFLNLEKITTAIHDACIFSFLPKMTAVLPLPWLQTPAKILGNIRIFKLLTRFTLGNLTNAALAISHFLFSADAFQKVMHTTSMIQKNYLWLQIIKNNAGLTLALMTMGNIFNPFSIGIVSLICIALEIISLIYKEKYVGN